MKITKAITVDLEIWLEFTKKVEYRQYSATIQQLIKAYNDTEDNIKLANAQKLEIKIKELQSELAKVNKEREKLELEKKKTEKQTSFSRPLDKWEAARQKLAEERANRYDKGV